MGSHHKRNEGMKPVRRTAAKPKPERKARPQELTPQQQAVLVLQQNFLDILQDHFRIRLDDPDFDKKLQTIKGHFFRREYAQVFGDKESCIIYAVRYLPSRALAYSELFTQRPILDLLYPPPPPRRPSEKKVEFVGKRKKIVAVGAGVGSELCALHLLPQLRRPEIDIDDTDMLEVLNRELEIDVVDSADYNEFLSDLTARLDQDRADVEGTSKVKYTYHREDILGWSESAAFTSMLAETTLLTFMFVFNELFASSKLQTMKLIASIAKHLPKGSHVLLIESAGDLSQVKLGMPQKFVKFDKDVKEADDAQEEEEEEAGKGLMVYKFWDHLPGFEKVMSDDRRWFRLNPSLKYPLEMENVGYFARLYRKMI